MATAKKLRELADLQATRNRQHAAALRALDGNSSEASAIETIATVLTERADHVEADRLKAWQGNARALRDAAERVLELVPILENNPPPTSSGPNPHREPLPPDHRAEQFVSPLAYEPGMVGQHIPGPDAFVTPRVAADLRKAIEDAPTTDAKLDIAFRLVGNHSDALARINSDPSTIAIVPVVHITRESEGEYAYCPATSGQRAYRGAANCPECIELHSDRYANMRWTTITSDAPPAPPVTNQYLTIPTPEQEYRIGDTVSVGGIEFTKIREMPSIENMLFGEPPPAATEIKINDEWTDVTGHVVRIGDPIPEPLNVVDPARPIVPMPMQPRPRMTMEQVVEHGRARARGVDHRSHSQLVEYEGCGTKYAIGNLARVPSWWNVGGNAVHSAIESINRTFAHDGTTLPSRSNVADLWRETFHITVAEAEYASDVPHEAWAAAKKGAEAYDWWRVNGEDMVDRWAVRLGNMADGQGWQIAVINGEPVIEYQYRLQIHGSAVPDLGYIDLALFDGNRYLIVDFKAGGSTDHDHMQVGGQYRWGLWSELKGAVSADLIDGVFWQARTGETIEATRWDYATMCARIAAMDVQERAGIYAPKTGWYCKGCQVRDLCPAGPAS